MCICINCKHINQCKTYKFIQEQHQMLNKKYYNIDFYPLNTIISVNINRSQDRILLDWDLQECSSFTEQPNNWMKVL